MMTKEEKELLLKVLCSMLPYGVKYRTYLGDIFTLKDITLSRTTIHYYIDDNAFSLSQIKPYLRPMSSMTEEEDKEWQLYKNNIACSCDENLNEKINELHDWFNEHHFDYRGLIKKGLALEAPENMYKL